MSTESKRKPDFFFISICAKLNLIAFLFCSSTLDYLGSIMEGLLLNSVLRWMFMYFEPFYLNDLLRWISLFILFILLRYFYAFIIS